MKEEVILRTLAQESLGVGVMVENIWSFEVLLLFCKIPGIIDFGLVFELKNLWARSRVVDHRNPGPQWTGLHCQPVELTGAQPTAALGLWANDQGVGEGSGAWGIHWAAH
jgi:hypothetical protein